MTGNVRFILSVEGKNVVHEFKGESEYGLSDGQVSMTVLFFRIKTTFQLRDFFRPIAKVFFFYIYI